MAASPPKADPPARRWLRRTLQLILTAGVTWFIVDRVGVSLGEVRGVGDAIPEVRLGVLALSSFLLLAGFLLSARLWGRMVEELGSQDPGLLPAARIVFSANLGRYIPGKLWQVAGLALLARRASIPMATGTAAALLIQGFLLLAAAVVGAPALFSLLGGARARLSDGAILLPLLVLLALGLILTAPPVLRALLSVGMRLGRVPRGGFELPQGAFGLRWLLLHVMVWGLHGAAFTLFIVGLGLSAPPASVVPAFAAAYLLGYLALFAPAGLGVREGFLIAFLRPELGAAAVGVALLARVWMTVVELLPAGGLALWEVLRRAEGNQLDGETPTGD